MRIEVHSATMASHRPFSLRDRELIRVDLNAPPRVRIGGAAARSIRRLGLRSVFRFQTRNSIRSLPFRANYTVHQLPRYLRDVFTGCGHYAEWGAYSRQFFQSLRAGACREFVIGIVDSVMPSLLMSCPHNLGFIVIQLVKQWDRNHYGWTTFHHNGETIAINMALCDNLFDLVDTVLHEVAHVIHGPVCQCPDHHCDLWADIFAYFMVAARRYQSPILTTALRRHNWTGVETKNR